MKIIACSDIHGDFSAFRSVIEEAKERKVDLLIIAGDIFPWPTVKDRLLILEKEFANALPSPLSREVDVNSFGTIPMRYDRGRIRAQIPFRYRDIIRRLGIEEFESILLDLFERRALPRFQEKWLWKAFRAIERREINTLLVFGNDDAEVFTESYPFQFTFIDHLHLRLKFLENIPFFGLGGAVLQDIRTVNDWDEFFCEAMLKDYVERLKSVENLVFISHCPPFHCLDLAKAYGRKRLGSKALRRFIEEVQPRFFICGHAHYSGGTSVYIGNTVVVNVASICSTNGEGRYAIIDLETGRIKWKNILS